MTNDEAADAPRILALLDALTAAEQRELELLKEQTAWRLHRDVAESIAKYWMDKDDAAGNEIAQLRAALTAKDEALAAQRAFTDMVSRECEVERLCVRNAEAESARLTAQVTALQTARDASEARETAYRQRVGTAEVALYAAERRADDAEAQVEALADVADCKHYVTTLVVKNNLWRDGMDAREMVYALAFANDKATEEALTRADHHEAESARLTFERDDLAREVSRRIDENIVSMNEHARLTAQIAELQQQLAEADAGDDVRAFERTVKEQSDRNVALQAQVEALQRENVVDCGSLKCIYEDRALAAEAQVTRLTEALERRIEQALTVEVRDRIREVEEIAAREDPLSEDETGDEWRRAVIFELRAALAPATPPATERCVCGHPGDTPTCPIDHDQIQHEQATPTESPTCAWTEDENVGWTTACGHFFQFNDGTPTENKQAFCGYCGVKLREVRYVDAPWEPE